MKGILTFDTFRERWEIHYDNGNVNTSVDVQPGIIENFNNRGFYFKDGQQIDFYLQDIESFPYRWGVPNLSTEAGNSVSPLKKKTVKFKEIDLEIVGSHYVQTHTIKCQRYQNSDFAWHFYNMTANNEKEYVAHFPVSCTCIIKIEEIEEEIE